MSDGQRSYQGKLPSNSRMHPRGTAYFRHAQKKQVPTGYVSDVAAGAVTETPRIVRHEELKLAERAQPEFTMDVKRPVRPDAEAWKNIKPALPRQKRSLVLHRSSFGPKIARKTRTRIRRQSRSYFPTVRAGFVTLLVIVGIGFGIHELRTNYVSKDDVAVLAKATNHTEAGIDETDRNSLAQDDYHVAADLPKYLRIPKLQVDARVVRLSAKDNNDLSVPGNIFDTGWYENSSKPGEKGAMLIDGHIAGPTKHGVFYSLGSLQPGDKLEIERGDGKVFTFKVAHLQLYDYDKVDMDAALRSITPGKQGLNLVSYSSRFDVRSNKFEQRLVVFAVQE